MCDRVWESTQICLNLNPSSTASTACRKIRSDGQHYETFRPAHKFKILMPEESWGHETVKYKFFLVQQGKNYTSQFSFSHPPSISRFQHTSDHLEHNTMVQQQVTAHSVRNKISNTTNHLHWHHSVRWSVASSKHRFLNPIQTTGYLTWAINPLYAPLPSKNNII